MVLHSSPTLNSPTVSIEEVVEKVTTPIIDIPVIKPLESHEGLDHKVSSSSSDDNLFAPAIKFEKVTIEVRSLLLC